MEVNVQKGYTFNMFDKVRIAIERYATETSTNLILGKMTKYPNGSSYRQAYFFCEKQERYSGKKQQYVLVVLLFIVVCKFDQNDLGFTKKLHNNKLCGQPPNNKHIRENEKNEENIMQKLDKNNKISYLPDTNDTNVDLCVYDPKSDTIFGDEECWQKIKTDMKFYLNEQNDLYSKKLEYDVSQLDKVLSYTSENASKKYWFYSSECAQLASDIFNAPVIVLAAESYFFMPFNQESGFCKIPIILQWH
ncbi:4083_t:CDS:2, partial [Dentiscutata heterogama]